MADEDVDHPGVVDLGGRGLLDPLEELAQHRLAPGRERGAGWWLMVT